MRKIFLKTDIQPYFVPSWNEAVSVKARCKLEGMACTKERAGNLPDIKDMETKVTHTLEELKEAAQEQNLRIEEKDGKYQVVRTVSERFGLIKVKAGAGFSLDHNELRQFLIFDSNRIDIGARITDWSKYHEPKLHQ